MQSRLKGRLPPGVVEFPREVLPEDGFAIHVKDYDAAEGLNRLIELKG